MMALLTSCGRHDLLEKTLDSFNLNQKKYDGDSIIVQDNSGKSMPDFLEQKSMGSNFRWCEYLSLDPDYIKDQHQNIEYFLKGEEDKYYLHLEDDWSFTNTYDWIQASIDIMEADPMVIKVLARKDSPHPCNYDQYLSAKYKLWKTRDENTVAETLISNGHSFGYLQPWENNGITWCGFSWNPGVTRLDLLRQFVPFGKHEQDVAQAVHDAGYKVVALENGVYTHAGEGRSTHD